jgi:hypothetical protein
MTGGWRKLHNEELHNLYSSPDVISLTKSTGKRMVGHVARMERKKFIQGIGWKTKMKRKKNVDIDGKKILKRTLEKCGGVV